jgi:Short C-terminal domain/Phospholipase_D-nuclease N-terminal
VEEDFGLWELIVSMFWFMLLVCWIWLLMAMIGDILRDSTLRGAAKAAWVLLIVFVPWLGAITYLLVRGDAMNERARRALREHSARDSGQETAAGNVSAELQGLADLRDRGAITPEEYEQAKAKVLA